MSIDLGYGNEVHFLSPHKLKLAAVGEFNEYIDFICYFCDPEKSETSKAHVYCWKNRHKRSINACLTHCSGWGGMNPIVWTSLSVTEGRTERRKARVWISKNKFCIKIWQNRNKCIVRHIIPTWAPRGTQEGTKRGFDLSTTAEVNFRIGKCYHTSKPSDVMTSSFVRRALSGADTSRWVWDERSRAPPGEGGWPFHHSCNQHHQERQLLTYSTPTSHHHQGVRQSGNF